MSKWINQGSELQVETCLLRPMLGLQVHTAIPGFLYRFWGFELISSCLLSKHSYPLRYLLCPWKVIIYFWTTAFATHLQMNKNPMLCVTYPLSLRCSAVICDRTMIYFSHFTVDGHELLLNILLLLMEFLGIFLYLAPYVCVCASLSVGYIGRVEILGWFSQIQFSRVLWNYMDTDTWWRFLVHQVCQNLTLTFNFFFVSIVLR